ncbi:MAG: TrkA C-terminal domain-containing protein [Pseudomonadales bacterium]
MSGLYYVIPTLATIVVSILIVRAGAIALVMTGMDYEKAKFQALSAFSGTGFTTREAERVVGNARRRRIISLLMILGNAGIVTVIVATTSSFANARGLEAGVNVIALVLGLGAIIVVARHAPFVRRWEAFARERLSRLRIFEDDATLDELLHLAEGYGVVRIRLSSDSKLIGQTLVDVNSGLEHSFILGIEHDRQWVPTPRLTGTLKAGDYLVIYGKLEDLQAHFSGNDDASRERAANV